MDKLNTYYATAQCFTTSGTGSCTIPAMHRYFLFTDFDDDTIKLVNEITLRGEWSLLSGKKEMLDFNRTAVSNGRELSEITLYTGQIYKRTPLKKTFKIGCHEFREKLFNPAINAIVESDSPAIVEELKVFEVD